MTSRSMTPARPSSREADASRSRPKRRRPCSPASRSRACCAGWARRRYGNCDTTPRMAGARSSDADGVHGLCSGRQHGSAMDGALPLKSHWCRIKRYDQCAPLRPMPLRIHRGLGPVGCPPAGRALLLGAQSSVRKTGRPGLVMRREGLAGPEFVRLRTPQRHGHWGCDQCRFPIPSAPSPGLVSLLI